MENTCGMEGLVQPESWHSTALLAASPGENLSALPQWALTLLALQVQHGLLDLSVA